MLHACEREGEDDMIDSLEISCKKHRRGDDSDDDHDGNR